MPGAVDANGQMPFLLPVGQRKILADSGMAGGAQADVGLIKQTLLIDAVGQLAQIANR